MIQQTRENDLSQQPIRDTILPKPECMDPEISGQRSECNSLWVSISFVMFLILPTPLDIIPSLDSSQLLACILSVSCLNPDPDI